MATVNLRDIDPSRFGGERSDEQRMNDYVNLYKAIQNANVTVSKDQSGNYQIQQQASPMLRGYYEDNPSAAPTRSLNGLERGLTGLYDTGEKLMNVTGWDPNAGFTLPNMGRFVAGLPFQMVGGMMSAGAQGYEGLTGENILDRDANGNAYDYDLNTKQQLGQLGNFIINGPAMFMGGTGQAIGTAGKLLTGGKVVTKGVGGAIGKALGNSKTAKAIGNLAWGAAEESAEEFGQSFMDDARWNTHDEQSLDRAILGAEWGALGGGVFSGAATGVQAIANNANTKRAGAGPASLNVNTTPTTFEIQKNQDLYTGREYTDSAAQYISDKATRDAQTPGSASALNLFDNDDLNLMQVRTGEDIIRGIWESNTRAQAGSHNSREHLADAFGTTEAELDRIYNIRDINTRVAALNNLIAQKGGFISVIAGRNPDTNPTGTARVNIVGITPGSGLRMNRQLASLFKADYDGDKTQIYFDQSLPVQGYATRNLVSAVTGASNMNADYLSFLGDDNIMKADGDLVSELRAIGRRYPHAGNGPTMSTIISGYNSAISSASDVKERNNVVAVTLDETRKYIVDSLGGEQQGGFQADDTIATLMHDFERRASRIAKTYAMASHEADTLALQASQLTPAAIATARAQVGVTGKVSDTFNTPGGATSVTAAQLAEFVGDVIDSRTKKGNPFLRQSAAKSMSAHAWHPDMMNHEQLTGLIDFSIAYGFQISSFGADVETAIEGLFQAWVKDRVAAKFGDDKISINDLSRFKDEFITEYNSATDSFNKAKEIDTTRGSQSPLGVAPKPKISQDSIAEFSRAFSDIYGDFSFDEIFHIPDDVNKGITINAVLADAAASFDRGKGMYRSMGAEFSRFFDILVAGSVSKQVATASRVEKGLNEIYDWLSKNKAKVVSRTDANGRTYYTFENDRDYEMMRQVIDAFHQTLGPNVAVELGIDTPEGFLDSTWGKRFMADTNSSSDIYNIHISTTLSSVYKEVIALVSDPNYKDNAGMQGYVQQLVDELSGRSFLGRLIYDDFVKNNGTPRLLAELTSLDKSFEDKQKLYDILAEGRGISSNLMADTLALNSVDPLLDPVTNRLIKAHRSLMKAGQRTRRAETQAMKEIRRNIDSNAAGWTLHSFRRVMELAAGDNAVQMSSDLVAAAVEGRRHLIKSERDKGMNPMSTDMVAQSLMDIIQGDSLSFLDSMEMGTQRMTVDNFQNNRRIILGLINFNIDHVTVWDPSANGSVTITPADFYEIKLGHKLSDPNNGPTDAEYFALFEADPGLMSMAMPQRTSPVSDGSAGALHVGKTGDTMSWMTDEINQYFTAPNRLLYRNAINSVKNKLMNSPQFWGHFIASMPDIANESITLAQTRGIVDRELNRWATAIVARASMTSGSRAVTSRGYEQMRWVTGLFNDVIDTTIFETIMRDEELKMFRVASTEMAEHMASTAWSGIAASAISRAMSDAGLTTQGQFLASTSPVADLTSGTVDRIGSLLDSYVGLFKVSVEMIGDRTLNLPFTDTNLTNWLMQQISHVDNLISTTTDPAELAKYRELRRKLTAIQNGDLMEIVRFAQGQITPMIQQAANTFSTRGGIAPQQSPAEQFIFTDAEFNDAKNSGDMTALEDKLRRMYAAMPSLPFEKNFDKDELGAIRKWVADPADTRAANEFSRRYNTMLAKYFINSINQSLTAGSINDAAVISSFEGNEFFDSAVREAANLVIEGDRSGETIGGNNNLEAIAREHDASMFEWRPIFNYKDPAVQYMASSALINFSGATITSGISINGSMTKLLGGSGMLPSTFMSNITQSNSASNPDVNMMGRIIGELCNFMQEPMFLKLKKTLSSTNTIVHDIEFNNELAGATSWTPLPGEQPIQTAQRLLDDRRAKVASYWSQAFSRVDTNKELNFSTSEYNAIAYFTTPYVEFTIEEQGPNGPITSNVIVNSSKIVDGTFGTDQVDQRVLNARIIGMNPCPLSLSEISAKIIREVSNKYVAARNNGGDPQVADINAWAEQAALDWESYTTGNQLSKTDIVNGVALRPRALDSWAPADFSETSMQSLLQDITKLDPLAAMRAEASRRNPGRNIGNEPMSHDAKSRIDDFVKRMSHEKGRQGWLFHIPNRPQLAIPVTFTHDKNASRLTDGKTDQAIVDSMFKLNSIDNDGTGSDSLYVPDGYFVGGTIQTVDMIDAVYTANDQSMANRVYRAAERRGRGFMINASAAHLVDMDARVKMTGTEVTVNGIKFRVYDTSRARSMHEEGTYAHSKDLPVNNPDQIFLCVGSDLMLPDASAIVNPNKQYEGLDIRKTVRIRTSDLTKTSNQILFVDNPAEKQVIQDELDYFANPQDPRFANKLHSQLDMSYYDKKSNPRSIQSYMDAMRAWVANPQPQGMNGMMLPYASGVNNGDCLGFLKTRADDGSTVYIPLFYEGNVAVHGADVAITVTPGEIRYTFDASSNIADSAKKLKIGGMSYKAMATSSKMPEWFSTSYAKPEWRDAFGTPDVVFDNKAFNGRIIEVGHKLLFENLYWASRKTGGNLFFKRDANGQWQLKDNLSSAFKQKVMTTPNFMQALMNNESAAWESLRAIPIFEGNAELNSTIQNLVSKMLYHGVNPGFFFCPTGVRIVSPITQDASGKLQCTTEFDGQRIRAIDVMMILGSYKTDQGKIMAVFNQIDDGLCAASMEESIAAQRSGLDEKHLIDHYGRVIALNLGGQPAQRVNAVINLCDPFGEDEGQGDLSRQASYSNQHIIKRMMDLGVFPQRIKDMLKYEELALGRTWAGNGQTLDDVRGKFALRSKEHHAWMTPRNKFKGITEVGRSGYGIETEAHARYKKQCSDLAMQLNRDLKIVKNDRTDIDGDKIIQDRIDSLETGFLKALGWTGSMRGMHSYVSEKVRQYRGYIEGDNGYQSLTIEQFENAIKAMIANIDRYGIPVLGGRLTAEKGDTRVHIPLTRMTTAMDEYAHSSVIRGKFATPRAYFDAMNAEAEKTLDTIKAVPDRAKRNALYKLYDSTAYSWEARYRDDIQPSGYIDRSTTLADLMEAQKDFASRYLDGYLETNSAYIQNVEISQAYLEKMKDRLESSRREEIIDSQGGKNIIFRGDDKTIISFILRQLSATRRAMGVLNPFTMLPANILERVANQGTQSMALTLAQSHVGPYAYMTNPLPRGFAKQISKDRNLVEAYAAYRTAEMQGKGAEFLLALSNTNDVHAAIEAYMTREGLAEKWSDKIMNIMSGKDVMISGQIQNFIDYFAMHSEFEAPYWLQTGPDGKTVLEQRLLADPTGWFIEVVAGKGPEVGADVVFAAKCLNWAKRGDMAQKNLISSIYSEIARRSSTVDFFTTAFVSPYFNYATNRLMKIMQWVSPISTIHFMLTRSASEGVLSELPLAGTGLKLKNLNLESAQWNVDIREAIAVDMMHLGPVLVAFLLLGTTGAIEPPEDEDKWGNFEEWTILGQRVDMAWWIEDLLGLALPLACFGASAREGKPRLDILVNGMTHYLSNNPVVKVADAVAVLFDPFEELYRDYDDTAESYAKALGGTPSFQDMVNGKMTSFGLSFAAQFITPLFLREMYNSAQQWEVSANRIYEEGKTGRPTEAGIAGATQMTTYQDSILRHATKNNPVMGFLADMLIQPNTGYMYHEMPRTVIYDPLQMNSIEAYSMWNDPRTKQSPKTDKEKQAIGLEVIAKLQSESVEELKAEGFAIDYDTRVYVSKMLWDAIATENNEFTQLQIDGKLDYYEAGDGDWSVGQQRVAQIKKDHYALIESYKDLYYNKLWNKDFGGIVTYNQRRTQWAQDANGEWYATGGYPRWYMPINILPGESQTEYQPVMSRENDWATESWAVRGQSTGVRALVPTEDQGYGDIPAINSWSEDGSDTGHSDEWNKTHPDDGTGSTSSTTPGNTSSSRSGGSRSGGSGGGGSAPNIYARNYTPNAPTPSTQRRTSIRRDPNLDALRPNFETKGSREAYKRGDI